MKRGFTIIELLMVIAILAVMASLAVYRLTGAQSAARDSRRESDIRQYQNAIEIYANANSGTFPIRTSNTVPSSLCGSGNPLGAIPCPNDPTGTTSYQYNSNAAGTQYILWATLEKPNPTEVYYVCSSGFAGQRTSAGFNPSGGACP